MDRLDDLLAAYGTESSPGPKPQVLVVDDEPGARRGAASVLTDYAVLEASDGADGLAKVTPEIHCVIMDARMPGMDGFQAATAIAVRFPDLPIIMHTAYHGEHRTSDVVGYHFFAYVEKGSEPQNIRMQVRNAVEHHRHVLEIEQYRRHLERKVEEQTAELREANKREEWANQQLRILEIRGVGTDLAAQILHDYKNLMQPISILLSDIPDIRTVLKKLIAVEDSHPELAARLHQAIDFRLARLAHDGLEETGEHARVAEEEILGLYECFRQVFNPSELGRKDLEADLRASIRLVMDRNARSYIACELQCEPVSLPTTYDPQFMNIVFRNILKNAKEAIAQRIQAEGPIGSKGRVLVTARREGPKTLIAFYDDGIGLPPGDETRVFEKQFTTKASGTGLGLFSARFILEEVLRIGTVRAAASDLSAFRTRITVELQHDDPRTR